MKVVTAQRVAAWLVMIVMLFGAQPAGAHTEVQSASPGPGEETSGAVSQIELVFLDEIMPGASVEVSGPSGPVEPSAVPELDGRILRAPIEEVTETGDYVVRYSFTALDGDHQSEAFRFRIVDDADWNVPTGALIALVGVGCAVVAATVRRRGADTAA